ncbi:MAG: D-aminoacyl-tRNA deacylase [Flavobacterium sp.]
MKVVIQRVSEASVKIEGEVVAQINAGFLILVGIETEDSEEDLLYLVSKIIGLRIFNDENGVMNLSIKDVDGEICVVSQFTLHAATKKGNRPSYIKAAKADLSIPLYELFLEKLSQELGKEIPSGQFGADMKVSLINDGPVTIIIDSKNK